MRLFALFLVLAAAVGAAVGQQPSAAPPNPAATASPEKNAAGAMQDKSGISDDQVTKPAATTGTTLVGCLVGPDDNGNYSLHSMQHRDGVRVLGPDDMGRLSGDKVKLTGSWRPAAGKSSKAKSARRFQATQVDLVSEGCVPPTATTPISKKKQEQKTANNSPTSGPTK